MKIGDVVRLKSGSPNMTIHAIDGEFKTCSFWTGTKFEQATFPLEALDLVESAAAKLEKLGRDLG